MNANLRGKTTVIYARSSSDKLRDSLDDQVRMCRDFIEKNGGDPNAAIVLADDGEAAYRKVRPSFERLGTLITDGTIDVVTSESVDRLSRDLGESDRFWKLIAARGVRLILVSDGIDSAKRVSPAASDALLPEGSRTAASGTKGGVR